MDLQDLKIGDLILVKGQNLISKVIEDVEHSQYSHVAIYVGNNQLIEAEGFEKTGYVPVSKYEGLADVYRCNSLTEEQRDKIIKYLKKQVGTHYDYLLLFWEFIRYKFHVLLPYKEYNSHICSTLASDTYKGIGINLSPIKHPSPADIANSKLLRKVGTI